MVGEGPGALLLLQHFLAVHNVDALLHLRSNLLAAQGIDAVNGRLLSRSDTVDSIRILVSIRIAVQDNQQVAVLQYRISIRTQCLEPVDTGLVAIQLVADLAACQLRIRNLCRILGISPLTTA